MTLNKRWAKRELKRIKKQEHRAKVYAKRVRATVKGFERRQNTCSAPGEPPAVQTGRLFKSIVVLHPLEPLVRIIKATDQKASWMEFGTEKIAPRPFLRPALDRYAPKFPGIMKGLV